MTVIEAITKNCKTKIDVSDTGELSTTFKVIKFDGYHWAILHVKRDGSVIGIKLPFTGSPMTEPRAWELSHFHPEGKWDGMFKPDISDLSEYENVEALKL
jgi:hypothetical protein